MEQQDLEAFAQKMANRLTSAHEVKQGYGGGIGDLRPSTTPGKGEASKQAKK